MSPENGPAGTIEQEASEAEGVERADALLNDHIHQTGSVGEVRLEVHHVLEDVQGDTEAEARVHQYEDTFNQVAAGHDHVQLEEMEGGLQGVNQVGTHNSRANVRLFEAENLIEHTEVTDEVLDHEDDPENGHAGQIAGREGLVLADGEAVEGAEMYEGENEGQQGLDKRGSASAARAGQPAETYGSGQQKVAPHLTVFAGYLREGKDRLTAQAELLRGQNREKIMQTLGRSRRYTKEETLTVISIAA